MATEDQIEIAARALAYAYGSKMSGPGKSIATREFTWEDEGGHTDKYVEYHWREWLTAASLVCDALKI